MGLDIGVGTLAQLRRTDPEEYEWLVDELEVLNDALEDWELPPHVEPEELASLPREATTRFPYSFLHYLRRVYALKVRGQTVRHRTFKLMDADRKMVMELAMRMESHLICHSDAEGFYVPIDFSTPRADTRVAGEVVGSTQGLLRELYIAADAMELELADGVPTDAALARLREARDGQIPYWRALLVWHSLYEAAQHSLRHQTVILFT